MSATQHKPLTLAPVLTPEETASPAPVVAKGFFTVETYDDIPEDSGNNRSSLPWSEQFDATAATVKTTGKASGFFVPFSWFVRERGADAAKVTYGYVKNKLAEAFKKWPGKDGYEVIKRDRTGKESGYETQGPGVLFILRAKAPAPTE